MKHLLLLFAPFACLLMAGCSNDDIVVSEIGQEGIVSVGSPIQVNLDFTVEDFSSDVASTRADGEEEPVEDFVEDQYARTLTNSIEKKIRNFWLLEYDYESGNLIYDPQYFEYSTTGHVFEEVTLNDNEGSPVTLYIIANANGYESAENWITVTSTDSAGNSTYEGFMTIEDLLKQNVPFSKGGDILLSYSTSSERYEGDDVALPMSGCTENCTLELNKTITVSLNFMVAKVMFGASLEHFEDFEDYAVSDEFEQLSAQLYYGNALAYGCGLTALGYATTTTPVDYSKLEDVTWQAGETDPLDFTTLEHNTPMATYQWVLYMPENIQGVNGSDTEKKANNAPESAYSQGTTKQWTQDNPSTSWSSQLKIKDFLSSSDAFCLQAVFEVENDGLSVPDQTLYSDVVFPGGNDIDNFNIRRGCAYHVKFILRYDTEKGYDLGFTINTGDTEAYFNNEYIMTE